MQLGAYLNIAEQYMELNEYVVALNSLADYRRLKLAYNETEEPLYYKIRAHIFYRQKKYEEAISDLVQYTKLEPENLEGLELLGICYYRIGKFESGLQYFNRLIRLDEDNGKWYLYRGIYFYKKQDLNDAEGQFRFALDLDPSLFTAHYYLGKIYEERGELQSALEELRLYRQYMPAALGEDVDEPVPGIMFD
jgi:tetratricopeptide (TPR) repeat protein